MPTIDLRNVDAQTTPEPIPVGVYALRVDEASLEEGGKGPYFKLMLRVDEGDYENRVVFANLSTSEKALPMLKAALLAFGYTEDELHSPDFELQAEDFLGAVAYCKVGIRKATDQYPANNNIKQWIYED